MGLGGTLSAVHYRAPRPHKARSVHIPGLGRVIFTRDQGAAFSTGRDYLQSHLEAVHFDGDGKIKDIRDCGSGNVQSNFVVGLAQDALGTGSNPAAPILAGNKYMLSGTTATVNTYDFQLAASAGVLSTAITPTRTEVANGTAGTDATLQYVGSIAYTSTLSIVEWGLFNANVTGSQSTSTTNVPTATGTSSSTWGTAPSGVNAWAGWIVYASASSVAGFITANSTNTTASTITIAPGWYKLASSGGTGSTPGTNVNLQVYPLMIDHKSFGTISVVNGDSIQFTYTLQIVSGG